MADELNPYAPPRATEVLHVSRSSLRHLRGPSIALLILSALTALLGFLAAINLILMIGFVVFFGFQGEFTKVAVFLKEFGPNFGFMCVLILIGVVGVVVFRGALSMRSGRRYSSALMAAIVSCVPILSPCFVMGIPFGIWALVVLRRPKVRSAFVS